VEIVTEYSRRPPKGKPKRLILRFLVAPTELLGRDRVEGVRIAHNELVLDADGRLVARATDVAETIEAGLVLRSIGYRGSPVPGVPFDIRRATIHNHGGRVTDPETGEPIPGVYAAGWIKRGPSGVIGTNKKCAHETVALLLEDLSQGRLQRHVAGAAELSRLLTERQSDLVDYAAWEAIDLHERSLGEPQGRPRVKLTRVQELLSAGRGRQMATR
jgi:ferredoxin--NADP+ reductase